MTHLFNRINQYRDSPALFCPPAGTVPHALSLFGLGTVPVHDLNGNLTSDGTRTYTYDFENRLTSITGAGLNVQYTYDPFGRRIKKTVNGSVTRFIYDRDQILLEKDGSGSVIAQYTYGPGIDETLTMNRGGQTYYYFYDGLGSVTDLTKASGEVVESYSYDVYGNPLMTSSVGNRFLFTGREYDQETGLFHYRARTYSPTIGRFGQRDSWTRGPDDVRIIQLGSILLAPTGILSDIANNLGKLKTEKDFGSSFLESYRQNPLSLHPYTYVQNNPVNFVDPIGHEKLPASDADKCFEDCQQFCIDYLIEGDMEGWRRCFEACVAQWN